MRKLACVSLLLAAFSATAGQTDRWTRLSENHSTNPVTGVSISSYGTYNARGDIVALIRDNNSDITLVEVIIPFACRSDGAFYYNQERIEGIALVDRSTTFVGRRRESRTFIFNEVSAEIVSNNTTAIGFDCDGHHFVMPRIVVEKIFEE